MKLNNKGFAAITIIYSFILLISLIIVLTMTSLQTEYENNKELIEDINETLDNCIDTNKC